MVQEKCECHKCKRKWECDCHRCKRKCNRDYCKECETAKCNKYCQCDLCKDGGYCTKICMLTNTYTCYCDWDAYAWNAPQVSYICNDCNSKIKK
jgi:hypothetical protein